MLPGQRVILTGPSNILLDWAGRRSFGWEGNVFAEPQEVGSGFPSLPLVLGARDLERRAMSD